MKKPKLIIQTPTLDRDCLYQICTNLSIKEILYCRNVCKTWCHYLTLNGYWKPLVNRIYGFDSSLCTEEYSIFQWFCKYFPLYRGLRDDMSFINWFSIQSADAQKIMIQFYFSHPQYKMREIRVKESISLHFEVELEDTVVNVLPVGFPPKFQVFWGDFVAGIEVCRFFAPYFGFLDNRPFQYNFIFKQPLQIEEP